MSAIARLSLVRQRILPVFAIVVIAAPASAQDPSSTLPAYRNRLLGVYDFATGAAVEGAAVTDVKTGTVALTTKTGTVSLVFLPDGGGSIQIRKIGYEPVTQVVSIAPADTVPITVMLTPTTNTLPTVVTKDSAIHYISPGLREFEERRKTGPGHFISEADLRKSDNRKMQDVLKTLPGIQIICGRVAPFDCHAYSFRSASKYAIIGGTKCPVTIFVNGMISSETDLTTFNVNDYAGVESYLGGSTTPLKYNQTSNGCGVLLLWTRER